MSEQVERLLPILSLIPGVNIPAGIAQSVYIAASQRKLQQLETALTYKINLLNQKVEAGQLHLDREYVKSEAFTSNVIQAFRAGEIADSKEKIEVISSALAGCALSLELSNAEKSMQMRIVEQISNVEIVVLSEIIEKFKNISDDKDFVDQEELSSINQDDLPSVCRGLFQLGLLEDEKIGRFGGPKVDWWSPSPLALKFISLCAAF